MKVALYARVSTREGAARANGNAQDTENQLRELRAWAGRLGAESLEVYEERVSGGKDEKNRPALKRLLRDAHERRFDVVLVWALDRLSRQGIGPMLGYLERLKAAGVQLRSLQESWVDTQSPVTDLLLAIFAWVAQQERARISERVRAGLARADAKGRHGGRPQRSFDARRVRELLATKGWRGTLRELRCGDRALRRYLSTPAYLSTTADPAAVVEAARAGFPVFPYDPSSDG